MNNKEKRYTLVHYLFGALPARLGDEMSGPALLLLSLTLTHNVKLGSMVLSALTFSAAVGGPLLGAMLDRSPHPGKILGSVLVLYALGIVSMSLLLTSAPVWTTIVVALASGLCMPAISGGWSSRLTSFVADDEMPRASAIDAATFNIAGLIGPAAAGMVTALLGAHWAIAILVALLGMALPMAWSLPRKPSAATQSSLTLHQDILAGFRAIVHTKKLLRITTMSVISYMGIGMLWVLYPLVGRVLFGDASYGGMLASIVSVGALIATAAYAKWPTRLSADAMAAATTFVLFLAMIVLALANNPVVAIAAMLLVGFADGPQLAAIFTIRHREAPERSRSQVFTTAASLKIAAAALGAALAGQLSQASIATLALSMGAVQLIAAITFIAWKRD